MFKFDPLAKVRKWLTTSKTVSTEGKWFADAKSIYDLDQRFNYSTTEKVVGKWIDGKPVYQKTLQLNMPSSITDSTITIKDYSFSELGLSNIKDMWIYDGFVEYNGQYSSLTRAWGSSAYYYTDIRCLTNINNGVIRVETSRSVFANAPVIATIRYTKTTD